MTMMEEMISRVVDKVLTMKKPAHLNLGLFVGVTAQRPVSSSINCNRHLFVFLDLITTLTAKIIN